MKFFSFASKFNVFNRYNTRAISYKIRKSLIYILTKMEQDNKSNAVKVHFTDKGQQTQCPRFLIQVLANGASGSGGIIIHTGKESYLFNCGEGTQRCASSYGIKLSKVYAAFVTSHTWANIGGIMGTALTLQSLGVKKFLIYGPPAIKKVIGGWESFVLLKTLTVKVISENPELMFEDGFLKIQFVPLYSNFIAHTTHKSNSDSLLNADVGEVKTDHSEKKRSYSEARKPSEESDMYVQCYICKTPNFGQHIDIKTCLEKGLEIGPILKVLQNKKSVTLSNGKVVHLDEVCNSDGEYKIFIVVECPSTEYLDSLLNEKAFTLYQNSSSKPADLVIHFTPPEVINEPLYQEWISRFPESTKHLIINSDNSCADLVHVHHVQTKLNYLSQEIFPVLNDHHLPLVKEEFSGKMGKTTNLTLFSCKDEKTEEEIAEKLAKLNAEYSSRKILQSSPKILEDVNGISFIRPLPTLSLQYHPKQSFDYKHNIVYDPLSCINEIKYLDCISEDLNELTEFNRQWKDSDEYKSLSDYPKVLFLGTGSSTPSRYRSTSAVVVYPNEDNIILLDCGEGTYQQLVRLFGKEKMPEFMKKLKMIFVSHHHADHHLGMINILIMRQKLLVKNGEDTANLDNILLLIPSTISDWLLTNSTLYKSYLHNTHIVKNSNLGREYSGLVESLKKIGLSEVRVCRVEHCRNSSGISITNRNNFKITYSGDCRPSSPLIEIGKNSNLLIHEATFEDDLEAMAKQKFHSTISQAIDVGKQMNAKFTILTHFSQRYSHVPRMPNGIPDNVAIAFDNMKVSAKTLPILRKMFNFYKIVFADKIEKLNTKTLKRSMKRENNESEVSTKMRIAS